MRIFAGNGQTASTGKIRIVHRTALQPILSLSSMIDMNHRNFLCNALNGTGTLPPEGPLPAWNHPHTVESRLRDALAFLASSSLRPTGLSPGRRGRVFALPATIGWPRISGMKRGRIFGTVKTVQAQVREPSDRPRDGGPRPLAHVLVSKFSIICQLCRRSVFAVNWYRMTVRQAESNLQKEKPLNLATHRSAEESAQSKFVRRVND